jgi:hypothetical protein
MLVRLLSSLSIFVHLSRARVPLFRDRDVIVALISRQRGFSSIFPETRYYSVRDQVRDGALHADDT